jgi:hypothetical protein
MPGDAVRPCLRIRRLGVRIPSGAPSSAAAQSLGVGSPREAKQPRRRHQLHPLQLTAGRFAGPEGGRLMTCQQCQVTLSFGS